MRPRLVELHVKNILVRKIRAEKLGGNWKDSNKILHYQGLSYIFEIIRTKLISKHNNNALAGHFSIKKTQELVAKKYYWEIIRHDVEVYVRESDVFLATKAAKLRFLGTYSSWQY